MASSQPGRHQRTVQGFGNHQRHGRLQVPALGGGGTPDTFRIRTWEEDEESGTETDVYDNGFDQEIGGGSIVIHTGKNK